MSSSEALPFLAISSWACSCNVWTSSSVSGLHASGMLTVLVMNFQRYIHNATNVSFTCSLFLNGNILIGGDVGEPTGSLLICAILALVAPLPLAVLGRNSGYPLAPLPIGRPRSAAPAYRLLAFQHSQDIDLGCLQHHCYLPALSWSCPEWLELFRLMG